MGRKPGFISDFLKGKTKRHGDREVQQLAKERGVSESYLSGLDNHKAMASSEGPVSMLSHQSLQNFESVGDLEEMDSSSIDHCL